MDGTCGARKQADSTGHYASDRAVDDSSLFPAIPATALDSAIAGDYGVLDSLHCQTNNHDGDSSSTDITLVTWQGMSLSAPILAYCKDYNTPKRDIPECMLKLGSS